jgi:hypothetical protein
LDRGESDDEVEEDVGVDPEFGAVGRRDDEAMDLHAASMAGGAQESRLAQQRKYLDLLGSQRRITYSIVNYNQVNDFGPFYPDGKVNWAVLDAIAGVMDSNVAYVSGRSGAFRPAAGGLQGWEADEWTRVPFPDRRRMRAVRASDLRVAGGRSAGARPGEDEDEETEGTTPWRETVAATTTTSDSAVDWAGVEGEWRGTYAFME